MEECGHVTIRHLSCNAPALKFLIFFKKAIDKGNRIWYNTARCEVVGSPRQSKGRSRAANKKRKNF